MTTKEVIVEIPKLLRVSEDAQAGTVILDVRGPFHTAESHITEEIFKLRELAHKHQCIEVHIRSDGGSVETLLEIVAAVQLFSKKVTIAYSCAASAGSLLWAIGDLKVVAPHSYVMFHRESFGSYGKVEEQLERIQFVGDLCKSMMDEYYVDILTPEEMKKICTTEVFLTSQQLIDRGVCISLAQYTQRNLDLSLASKSLVNVGGVVFLLDTTTLVAQQVLNIELGDSVLELFPDLYKTFKVPDEDS
jgi:ATP-dependent protease ClpP protease subunit